MKLFPLLGALACATAAQADFQAGFARTEINPPLGSNIPGYFSDRRVEGILDDIEANAVALSDGTNAAVLISFDLVEIKGLSTAWRQRAAAATGLPPEAFYFACTHTHTGGNVGPAAASYEISFDSDPAYDARVLDRFAALHERAVPVCADLEAALPRFGRYRVRLTDALERARGGEVACVADTTDSYHTVWAELHEDLLATLGIPR